MFVGILLYKFNLAKVLSRLFWLIHNLFKNKYFFDELYDLIFVRPIAIFARFSKMFDANVIDELGPGFSSKLVSVVSRFTSYLQSGYIFTYAFFMLLGVIGVMSYWIIHMVR